MIKKEKKNQEILNKLKSGVDSGVIEAIKELRVIGNVSYLPDVLDSYKPSVSTELKKVILSFISDIKDKNAVPYIVAFLAKVESEEDLALFTSACWQSSLDYNEHIDFFTDLIILRSYQTAIEAFTTVENCLHCLSDEEIHVQIKKLKDAVSDIPNEKKLFIVEIVNTMESYMV